ncbi:hypothetical protein [Caulobacter sp. RHG1]|uniref:hypothetical protein n=1 Tax=Caulobacter sp. (strain RHG1) TaxID=2545762 RepID=UPI0015569C2C|nr:hypothetical protein [Caulobacter sp. RHG1]NQE64530.1 hypothetical protein [Caulobacter sp. RHG1]
MKYICLAVVAATLAACDAAPPPEPPKAPPAPQPITFERIRLEGGPDVAKAAGFTRCETNEGTGFTCYRDDTTVLGIKAESASVRLDHPTINNGLDKDTQRLAYDTIVFKFPDKKRRENCEYDGDHPFACDVGEGGLSSLDKALREQGYVLENRRYGYVFTSIRQPVQVTVGTNNWDRDEVRVSGLGDADWKEQIARYQARQSAAKAESDQKQDFVRSMAAP